MTPSTVRRATPGSDPRYTHTWHIDLECGHTRTSHARLPPITACCPCAPQRRSRLELWRERRRIDR